MASVQLSTSRSASDDPGKAAEEALASLSGTPKVVFGFVAGPFDHAAYHSALHARMPKGTRLITSSTGGEITNEGYFQNSLVVTALSGDLNVGIGKATGLTKDAPKVGSVAIEGAARELGIRIADLDRRHGAIVIDDGFKMKKEEMLLGVLEKNQGLMLVGGGAGGYEFMQGTGWMGVDGEVFSDGALVMLFETTAPWGALRSHWYEPTGQRVRVTKVDLATRRIVELDGKSAGARWAELLDMPPDQLTLAHPQNVLRWMLATKVGREYFLRSVGKSFDADTLESMNMIQEDQEFEVMKAGDVVGATKRFFEEELPRRVPNPTAAILFDCGARKFYSMLTGKTEELGSTFKGAPPSGGFTVQFETYCGFMVSSTLTSLVFGSSA